MVSVSKEGRQFEERLRADEPLFEPALLAAFLLPGNLVRRYPRLRRAGHTLFLQAKDGLLRLGLGQGFDGIELRT